MSRSALTYAWAIAIVAACSVPGHELPEVDILGIDKVAHVGLFLVLACLATWPKPAFRRTPFAWAGAALAVLTECYQWLLPIGRSFDPYDVFANLIGLFAGIAVCSWRARHTNRAH